MQPRRHDNVAQALNHEFFWRCLTPKQAAPGEELVQALSAAPRTRARTDARAAAPARYPCAVSEPFRDPARARPRPAVLLLAVALAGCMPRAYERQVPVLEGATLDAYTVQHGEAGDCLLRRILPVRYAVRRPAYALQIVPVPGYRGEPLQLELRLEGDGLTARAPGTQLDDRGAATPGQRRYRLAAPPAATELRIEIHRGADALGVESFRLVTEQCRALLWKDE